VNIRRKYEIAIENSLEENNYQQINVKNKNLNLLIMNLQFIG